MNMINLKISKQLLPIMFLFVALQYTNKIAAQQSNIYDYSVKSIDGEPFALSQLKGKKVMIVNVASACGLTPQYKQLQEVYEMYNKLGFEIIAFPANDFGNQESGTNKEIESFCSINFGITFPIMEKIVVTGVNKSPIYSWLTKKELNNTGDYKVKWNFQKFLIERDGTLSKVIQPSTLPNDPEIIEWIKR